MLKEWRLHCKISLKKLFYFQVGSTMTHCLLKADPNRASGPELVETLPEDVKFDGMDHTLKNTTEGR